MARRAHHIYCGNVQPRCNDQGGELGKQYRVFFCRKTHGPVSTRLGAGKAEKGPISGAHTLQAPARHAGSPQNTAGGPQQVHRRAGGYPRPGMWGVPQEQIGSNCTPKRPRRPRATAISNALLGSPSHYLHNGLSTPVLPSLLCVCRHLFARASCQPTALSLRVLTSAQCNQPKPNEHHTSTRTANMTC